MAAIAYWTGRLKTACAESGAQQSLHKRPGRLFEAGVQWRDPDLEQAHASKWPAQF